MVHLYNYLRSESSVIIPSLNIQPVLSKEMASKPSHWKEGILDVFQENQFSKNFIFLFKVTTLNCELTTFFLYQFYILIISYKKKKKKSWNAQKISKLIEWTDTGAACKASYFILFYLVLHAQAWFSSMIRSFKNALLLKQVCKHLLV